MATADLLLHPVRLRILQAVLDGRSMTTSELRTRMPDVAAATMYRHVALLARAGVLEVMAEQRVRGAVERRYRLHREATEIDPAARAAMTTDDHRRAFTTFATGLLADFDRYLAGDPADPTADRVTYRQAALWLTDQEADQLLAELRAVVAERAGLTPDGTRTRRLLSMIAMPDPAEAPTP